MEPGVDDDQAVVDYTDGKRYNANYRNSQAYNSKVCSYCGRVGHTNDVCYQKHGFPPNSKPRNSTHLVSGEDIDTKNEDLFSAKDLPHSTASASTPTFTQDEYKTLLNLLKEQNPDTTGPTINHVNTLLRVLGESSHSYFSATINTEGKHCPSTCCLWR